ncbi:MAG: hypothetical protein WC538_21165 [Thermoanaerobaculia bacterium]|jgi:hypothetical protein
MRLFNVRSALRLGGLATLGMAITMACAPKRSVAPTLYEPTFTYEPAARTGGKGVSIALIEPSWPDLLPGQKLSDQDAKYAKSIMSTTTQMLTGAGITISGPFKSVDDMTFPEKQQADLILTLGVHTKVDVPPVKTSISTNFLTAVMIGGGETTWYEASGECSTTTSVDLVFWESLSKQRMWAKTVTVDGTSLPCSLERSNNTQSYTFFVANEYFLALQEGFPQVMAGIERYLDPAEVALVKSQSLELREKKVY